jgi:cell division septum initiation protein DivIVA
MPEEPYSQELAALEHRVAVLTTRLAEAKSVVAQWTDANASLSRSAAEARAENQGAGRGFFRGLLGPKFRGAMRSGAAASNAAIAKEVAEKRARITDGKRDAQELVRKVQGELADAKQDLKMVGSRFKSKSQTRVAAGKVANQSLDLLQKLKQAREAGLLTEEEFEQKRRKLVADL